MASMYRGHVSTHDLMMVTGAAVAIGGSAYMSVAETEQDRIAAVAMFAGGLAVELMGVLMRQQTPEDLVNAYNDRRW